MGASSGNVKNKIDILQKGWVCIDKLVRLSVKQSASLLPCHVNYLEANLVKSCRKCIKLINGEAGKRSCLAPEPCILFCCKMFQFQS